MKVILLLAKVFALVKICFSQVLDNFVFTKVPLVSMQYTSICDQNGYLTNIIALNKTKSCFIGWSNTCGVIVFNIEKYNDISYQYLLQDASQVLNIFVSSNQNIWIIQKFQIQIFNYKDLKVIHTLSYGGASSCFIDVLEIPSLYALLMFSERQIQFVDTYNFIVISSTFDLKASESSITSAMTISDKYIVLGQGQSINIIEILNLSTQSNTIIAKSIGYTFTEYNAQVTKMIDLYNNTFAIQTSTQGIYYGNYNTFMTTRKIQNITYQQLIQDKSQLQMKYLQTNQNKSYFVAEETFNGIKIIQFQQSQQFDYYFYQLIPINTKTYDLKLSFDNQYLISFTDKSINIYQNITSNYQNKQPNIVSLNKNILFNSFKFSSNQGSRCFFQENSLYYSKATDGLIILSANTISNTLQTNSVLNIDSNSHTFAIKIYKKDYLIVGDKNLYFYDISNPQLPKMLSNNTFNQQNLNANYAVFSRSQSTLFVAAGYAGLLIIDISDFKKPVLLSSIQTSSSIQYSCSYIKTYQYDRYIIASYQNLGIYIYDVSKFKEPQIFSFFPISAGQDFSIAYTRLFMVISNSDQGISIIDIADLKNLSLISRIYVQGSTQRAYLISNDQYILTTSIYSGQLQLIDITNIKIPKLIQQYAYNNLISAYDLCISSNYNTAYLAMGSGVVQFNLYVNKNFNINFFDLTNPNKLVVLDSKSHYQVGQQIGIQITEILPDLLRQVMITNTYYYDSDFQLQQLPSWSKLQLQKQILQINIEKELLKQQVINDSAALQFIFEVKDKLQDTDFIYASIGITIQVSQTIFAACLQNQIIDSLNYVIQYSQKKIVQVFSTYQQAQVNHILYVLNQRVMSVPVQFNISASLKYSADSNLITSLSDQVSIHIISNIQQGVFINKQFKQISVLYKEDLTEITLSGDLKIVNSILQHRIQFANFTNTKDINFQVIIDDGLNYQISQSISFSDQKFIKLNNPVLKNPKKSLQQDFENKNQNGKSLSVLTTFQYTFDSSIFVDQDSNAISYSAYIQQNDKYILIPQNFWISFEKSSRTFYGQIQINQFNEVVRLMVNATDGYTYSIDTFEIHLDIIPLYYVFTILLIIIIPILFLSVIYSFKSIAINLLRKVKLLQTPIQIELNRPYYLQMPILENCLDDGLEIWKNYKHTIIKEIVLRELTYLKLEKKNTEVDRNDNSCSDSRIQNAMLTSQNARMAQSTMKQSSAKQVTDKRNSKQILNLSQRIVKNMSNQEVTQIKKHLKEQKVNYNYSNFIYMQKDGQLNYKNILDSAYKWCTKHYNKPKVLNDLQNPSSLFSHFMIGLVATLFAQIDKTAENMVQMLKQQALKEGLSEKDWTSMYVEFFTNEDIVLYHPAPQPIYNQQKIDEQISLIQQLEQQISNSEFIMPLIKENLKAIALGYTSERKSYFPIARKLSLDCYTHEIHCIKVFRPFQKKSFFNKEKVIEVEKEKELSLNSLLPSWITSVDIINGSLFFQIQAQTKDQGRYQIKIFSTQNIIIKIIYVNVGNQKSPESMRINEEDKDFNITHQFSQYKQSDDQQSDNQQQLQIKFLENQSQQYPDLLLNLHNSNQDQHNIDSPQPLKPFRKSLSQYHQANNQSMISNQLGSKTLYKKNKQESKRFLKEMRDDISESNSQRLGGEFESDQQMNSPKTSPYNLFDFKFKQPQNQLIAQKV